MSTFPPLPAWFRNCGGYSPHHDLIALESGIAAGYLDIQDEYGLTALMHAVTSQWQVGVEVLLHAKAYPEHRDYRTGATALLMAVQQRLEPMVALLVSAGADPDSANYWGITPRRAITFTLATSTCFDTIPQSKVHFPAMHIQNAEHLADHHHPHFKIPKRDQRETIPVGQAVDLYIYGPKSESKQDTVKVCITNVNGIGSSIRYAATVETPIEHTHLPEGTTILEFGPEHIASMYVKRRKKKSE